MARLWLTYREGLALRGAVIADVPLQQAIPKLDLAPWRQFTTTRPEEVPVEKARAFPGRKRVLVEVGEEDREELSGLAPGFFESPYSLEECLRRVGTRPAA